MLKLTTEFKYKLSHNLYLTLTLLCTRSSSVQYSKDVPTTKEGENIYEPPMSPLVDEPRDTPESSCSLELTR